LMPAEWFPNPLGSLKVKEQRHVIASPVPSGTRASPVPSGTRASPVPSGTRAG